MKKITRCYFKYAQFLIINLHNHHHVSLLTISISICFYNKHWNHCCENALLWNYYLSYDFWAQPYPLLKKTISSNFLFENIRNLFSFDKTISHSWIEEFGATQEQWDPGRKRNPKNWGEIFSRQSESNQSIHCITRRESNAKVTRYIKDVCSIALTLLLIVCFGFSALRSII